MAGDATVFVGERIDEHQPLLRHDVAIGELAPHRRAVRRLHAVVVDAADAQIHLRGDDGEALRPPPMLHALRIGEALPHQIAWRVEHARDDEILARGLRIFGHVFLYQFGASAHFALSTIQLTPKRSFTMPKLDAKNGEPNGIVTSPPSDNALNIICASASVLTSSESAKPSNFGFPVLRPSDAISRVSPILRQECITLSALP